MKCTNKNTYVSTDAEAKGIVSIILNFLVIFMPITLAKRIVGVMLIAAGLPTEINFAKSEKLSYNKRMEKNRMIEYFEEVETEEEYDGYYYSVGEAITLVILGSICGLSSVRQIWMWTTQDIIKEFLKEKFQICRIPCYY